ncbi:MAG: HAD-IIIA family hydrolase [Ruminococcus sp.]|nr:HAD-IIIA family hydrolase [Ruminococcus sp.]
MNHYIAVIQAGGKGTRLSALTQDKFPKPMLPLNGKPMLQWQIENLRQYGFTDLVIIIGHLGDKIQEYFGDGSGFGDHITYIEEKEPLGSAGSLYYLKDTIKDRHFILIFGDVMFDLAWDRMVAFHEANHSVATLLVHPNSHPYDSDLILMDTENRITGMDSKANIRNGWYDNCVNAGIYILSGTLLQKLDAPKKIDLEKELLRPLMGKGQIYGYMTPEYVRDAGTVERFYSVQKAQKDGVWKRKNLSNMQRCIFLDRDGTLNRHRGLLSKEEEFELEPCAAEAVRLINESGYLAIVVTNQSVVARGMCDIEDVQRIHRKLAVLLGEQGAYLDDIAFCPHHPDKGYPEENPEYKINCNCRKPAAGMIDAMVEKYNIDRSDSYIVGDSTIDIQAGINAGLHTVLVHTGVAGNDRKYSVKAEIEAQDLLEAVKRINDIS